MIQPWLSPGDSDGQHACNDACNACTLTAYSKGSMHATAKLLVCRGPQKAHHWEADLRSSSAALIAD